MTKKDYILIADAIAKAFPEALTYAQEEAQTDVIESLCTALKRDNPRFDERKFMDACRNVS